MLFPADPERRYIVPNVGDVFKKILIPQDALIRQVLESGVPAPIKKGEVKPMRLMTRIFNMQSLDGESDKIWFDLSTITQCVQCGDIDFKVIQTFDGIKYMSVNPVSDCCGLVHYCNAECQKAHAKEHKTLCTGRFEFPIEMPTLTERGQRMITALHGLSCHMRREVKMAYVCASALGFMQSIELGGFREWWDYHTHEAPPEEFHGFHGMDHTQCTRHTIAFIATFNDRHDCLSFMPVTLGEVRVLFDPEEVLQVLKLWKKLSLMSDKKERAIIALALREHQNKHLPPLGIRRFRILPILLPQRKMEIV